MQNLKLENLNISAGVVCVQVMILCTGLCSRVNSACAAPRPSFVCLRDSAEAAACSQQQKVQD